MEVKVQSLKKAPSPGLLTQSDLSPKGEVKLGHCFATNVTSPWRRGRGAAAVCGTFPGRTAAMAGRVLGGMREGSAYAATARADVVRQR